MDRIMNKNKLFLMAIVLIITTLLMTACSQGSESSNENSQSSNGNNKGSSDSNQASGQVEIDFWTTNSGEFKEEIAKFEEENPYIKVTTAYMGNYDEMVQRIQAAIVADELPQVAQLGQRHGIPQMADSGKLLPIEDFLDEEDIEDIFDGFWNRFRYKDKLWTVPFQSSNPVMYYNKTLFEEHNVDVPDTWDELVEAAKKLTIDEDGDGTPEIWGFNMAADNPWYFQPMAWNRGSFLINEAGEVNLNSEGAVETLKSFQDLVHVHKAMPAVQHATAADDFVAGRLAIYYRSGSSLASLTDQVGDNFELGVAFLPKIKERHVPIGGNSLGIFESTPEQQEASQKLVQFLTETNQSAQFSMDSGYIAIRDSSLNLEEFQAHLEENPNFKVTIDQLEYLHGQPISPADSLIWGGIVDALETVQVYEDADPQEILDDLQAEVEAYLENYHN